LDQFTNERTVLLYQLAVGSALVDHLLVRHEPLLVNYHNLTPASFFWQWAPDWLEAVQMGRRQLVRLAPRVTQAIAVSTFNEKDLCDAGYDATSVVPPFVNVSALTPGAPPPDPVRGARRANPEERRGASWLFVGKLLPHKAAHDLIKALAAYRRAYDPGAHLTLVGGQPVASYRAALDGFVASLGLSDAVEFAGGVSEEALAGYYATADVFVCLSDHEGFCFPLLEAMRSGVPVVAFDAGAVAETLGAAGVLVEHKSPAQVAGAVHRVLEDGALRERLVAAGQRRLAHFALERTARLFVEEINTVVGRLDWSRDYGAGHR
jgi:glycosyltransferase involved in cell wall biosynthesis